MAAPFLSSSNSTSKPPFSPDKASATRGVVFTSSVGAISASVEGLHLSLLPCTVLHECHSCPGISCWSTAQRVPIGILSLGCVCKHHATARMNGSPTSRTPTKCLLTMPERLCCRGSFCCTSPAIGTSTSCRLRRATILVETTALRQSADCFGCATTAGAGEGRRVALPDEIDGVPPRDFGSDLWLSALKSSGPLPVGVMFLKS
mmetsp:Transcript_22805/g.57682  ORF Transcript_22805/g.57682 Transcript_22805/m.57682 type:complete len:204 (+) Transcript_22805:774-1385(+)